MCNKYTFAHIICTLALSKQNYSFNVSYISNNKRRNLFFCTDLLCLRRTMKLLEEGSKYVKLIWRAFQLGWKSVIWFLGLHGKVERSRGNYTKNSWEKVAFWHRIMQMGHILQFSHDGLPLKPLSQAAAMLMREMHQWTVSSQGLPKGTGGMGRGPKRELEEEEGRKKKEKGGGRRGVRKRKRRESSWTLKYLC